MHHWYYAAHEASPQGPVLEPDLRRLLGSGHLPASTLVWRDGMPAWLRADHPAVPWQPAGPPPLSPPPSQPAPAAAVAAPRERPRMPGSQRNTLLVLALCAVVVVGVVVLAILAAIAIPAYQQYVAISQVAQRLQALDPVRDAMVVHHRIHDQCPTADSNEVAAALARADTPGISELTPVTAINGHCRLSMVLDGLHRDEEKRPARLWLEHVPGQAEWICRSTLRDNQLPRHCRRDQAKD